MSANPPKPETRICIVLWVDYQLKSPNQLQYRHWAVKSRENAKCSQALGRALLSSACEKFCSMTTIFQLLQKDSEIVSLGSLRDGKMDWQYHQIQTSGQQGTIVLIEL